MFVGCFILEAVAFFSMFLTNISPIPLKQTFCSRQTLKQTMKRQTVKMISCHVGHLKRQTVKWISSCCDLSEFCQEDHGTSGHMDWKYHGGRTGSGQSDRKCRCDWTFVDPCFRMLRGFPQVEGAPMNLVCQNAQTL